MGWPRSSRREGGLEWGEPVSGFAQSCLLRADFRARSHTLLRCFRKKQICHDLWRMEVHPWISLWGFLITIVGAAEKLWALLAKMPIWARRLHVTGQQWRLSSTGGIVPMGSGPDRQHVLSFSAAEIADAEKSCRTLGVHFGRSLLWDNLQMEMRIHDLFLADTDRYIRDADLTKVPDKQRKWLKVKSTQRVLENFDPSPC